MIRKYSQKEKKLFKESGKILKEVKESLKKMVKEGVSELAIEREASRLIKAKGAEPAFLNQPGGKDVYPATTCISVNNQVVHHVPEDYNFKKNDIISVDLGVIKKNIYTDSAFTVYLGQDPRIKALVETTKKALKAGIAQAKPNNHLGDIGSAIEDAVVSEGFSIVKELSGHGIGYSLHCDPAVLNYGQPGQGLKLESGMAMAIEPIVSLGTGEIKQSLALGDSWTVVTEDGSPTAHFEDTIIITEVGNEVLTS